MLQVVTYRLTPLNCKCIPTSEFSLWTQEFEQGLCQYQNEVNLATNGH